MPLETKVYMIQTIKWYQMKADRIGKFINIKDWTYLKPFVCENKNSRLKNMKWKLKSAFFGCFFFIAWKISEISQLRVYEMICNIVLCIWPTNWANQSDFLWEISKTLEFFIFFTLFRKCGLNMLWGHF